MIEASQQQEARGLTGAEADKRLREFGPNQIFKPHTVRFLDIVREEITEPMILLLFAVGFFYAIGREIGDAIAIFSIIAALIFAEVWNEYRAKKTISSLSKLAAPTAKVMREGVSIDIETEQVVPGDLLLLTSGTRVAADGKVLLSLSLQVDESALTGESFPQEKKLEDEICAGTLVVSGEGEAEVTVTGEATKVGAIAARAQAIKEPKTPLQLAMKSLAKSLVWVSIFFSVAIPFVGFLQGQNLYQMFLTGLALAFATIPEELPIIITMVLGLGAYQLSRHHFLVKKIKAAEVLGDATVILTDKTGTITENKMQVVSVFPSDQEVSVLDAAMGALTELSSSPTDTTLMERADELHLKLNTGAIVRERSFDSERKTRSIIRAVNGNVVLFMSGAPEELVPLCEQVDTPAVKEVLERETVKGRRVIAVASKFIPLADEDLPFSALEHGLSFRGLIFLEDPPRIDVKETIESAHHAGIRTIMVTGDHPQTSSFVARSVGIASEKVVTGDEMDALSEGDLQNTVRDVSVFARTTPEDKYRLVNALHKNGEIVAVTGDGVNDTLALKAADIGIAMGIKGTDAAKEAADIVLADDSFVSLGHGIFEGRKFFDNLRKGVKFYLSVKAALIAIFLLPILVGVTLPFAPIQIIVLELFMDLGASAAFVAEPAEKTIYTRSPRDPKKKFLDTPMLRGIAASALSLFAAVTLSYFYALWQKLPLDTAQTFAFASWIITLMFLAYVSRSETDTLVSLGVFTNRAMDLWAVIAFAFMFIAIWTPAISVYLSLSAITLSQLGIILVISFVATSWQEVRKALVLRKNSKNSVIPPS